jgi:hypothetical protein
MITSSGYQVVTGACGLSGICPARIVTVSEKKLNPYMFLALTLNMYVFP